MNTNNLNSVHDFMSNDNIKSVIRKIIEVEMPTTFDTRRFIQCFTRQFQREYVELLYRGAVQTLQTPPFQYIHGQIGRFLSANRTFLGIVSKGRTISKDIFGDDGRCELWEKI